MEPEQIGQIHLSIRGLTFGALQDFVTLWRKLRQRDISFENLEEYVQQQLHILRPESARPCPECGEGLGLLAVNTGPRDQTGDASQSVWECNKCYYQEYNLKTVKEVYRERVFATRKERL